MIGGTAMKALILAALFASPVYADSLTLHLYAHHTENGHYEDMNPGFGYEKDNLTFGVIRDSYGKALPYAGKIWGKQRKWIRYRLALVVLRRDGEGLKVAPLPSFSFGNGTWVDFTYVPNTNGSPAILISLSRRF